MFHGMKADEVDRSRAPRPTALLRGLFFVFSAGVLLSLIFAITSGTWAENGTRLTNEDDYPELFAHIDRRLERMYLDLDRIRPRPLMERALSFLEMSADEIYVETFSKEKPYVAMHVDDKVKVLNLNALQTRGDMVQLLETVFQFLERHYHGDVPLNELRYAAANGFLSGIDPHTLVFTPENFDEFQSHIEGKIFGVGMMVGTDELGRLQVNTVLKDTPAQRAGFQKNDVITKIDDESTINMTVMEAVRKIRGEQGSKIVLTVRRRLKEAGDRDEKDAFETIAIPVERDRVEIKSVESKLLDPAAESVENLGLARGIGYVAVQQFDENTTRSLREHLERLESENAGQLAGLVIDLRGNSGGLLTQAISMSDTFLEKGDVVVTVRGEDDLQRTQARDDGDEPEYPILLLADEASASGAEIVLGALQKNHRALVLGTPSFGKGSVQQLHELGHGAQLKITVSEYLIPGDISIQENGVVPDILAEAVFLDDDFSDLFHTEDGMGEKNYETHIVSKYKKEEEPSFRLRYLRPTEGDEDVPSFRELFISGELRPESDPLVRMAWRVLRFLDEPKAPQHIFEKHEKDLENLRDDFEKEIAARLAELGTDWSARPEGAEQAHTDELDVDVTHEIVQKPSEDPEDPIPVNWLVVKGRATNHGSSPAWRLKAISHSEYYAYEHYEFLFGKVEPGETIERVREIRLPYFPNTQESRLRLELSGPDDQVVDVAETEVVLHARPRPAFAYSASLLRADGEVVEKLAPGDDYTLRVGVHNVGGGTAYKGVAILRSVLEKNGRSIFLKKGRIEFSDLEPEKSDGAPRAESPGEPGMTVEFRFDVRELPEDELPEQYEFELVIYDSYSNASLTRPLSIPREGARGPGFANGELVRAPRIDATLVEISAAEPTSDDAAKDSPLLVTTSDEVQLRSSVKADTENFKAWVLNLPITAENGTTDKVYFAQSNGGRELDLDTRVSLSPGVNFITVVAKDGHGVERRETLVVRRDTPAEDGPRITRPAAASAETGG